MTATRRRLAAGHWRIGAYDVRRLSGTTAAGEKVSYWLLTHPTLGTARRETLREAEEFIAAKGRGKS